jgi:hypothetical protein
LAGHQPRGFLAKRKAASQIRSRHRSTASRVRPSRSSAS